MIQIQIINIPAGVPPEYLSDGNLYLDLGDGFDLSFFKGIEELTDLDDITEEAILGFSIPATGKNKYILQAYDIENVYQEPDLLQIICTVDGLALSQDRIYAVGVGDEDDSIECEIIRSAEHWLPLIDYPICEIETLGDVEYNYTPMRDIINNNAKYEDGDPGYWFPLVNYGVWISKVQSGFFAGDSEAGISDFRPWVHLLSLLQKGFCQIGWNFRSELLESDYGRRLICYLLSEDLTGGGSNEGTQFAANFNPIFANPPLSGDPYTVDLNYNNITNPSSFFDGQFFALPGVFDFYTKAVVTGGNNPNDIYRWTLDLVRFNNGEEIIQTQSVNISSRNGVGTMEIIAKSIEVGVGDIIFTRLSAVLVQQAPNGASGSIMGIYAEFSNKTIKTIPVEGDIRPLKDLLNCDYNLIDVLKGAAHLFNLRFITDWSTRTVTAFPSDDIEVFGAAVPGYFRNTIQDVSPLGRTRSVLNIIEKTDRFALLEFKDSTDPGIEELDFTEDNPIHSKRVDMGVRQNQKTARFTNPFFEPTYNTGDSRIEVAGRLTDMPQVWDNTDNKISFKIGPRIIYAHGNVQVYLGPNMEICETLWLTSFGSQPTYPYAYALMGADHFINDGTGFIKSLINVVYGNVIQDLSRFWARTLYTRLVLKSISYNVFSNFGDYQARSFRDLYRIRYDESEYIGRLVTIENQQTWNTLASYTFIPEPNIPICDIIPEPEPELNCSNQPLILMERSEDGCYTFTAGGVVNSGIDTTLIEISLDNGINWTEQSVICCDEYDGEPFKVRLTQTYTDDCAEQIRVVAIDPCDPNDNYGSQCVIENNCFTIEVLGITDETFVIYYQINSQPEILYSGEVCAEYGDNITYRIEITSECCGEVEIVGGCVIPPLQIDCDFEFGVECVEVEEDDTRTFIRTGDLPLQPAMDHIYWRPTEGGDWCLWDCQPFTGCREFYRVLTFCDDICPTKCTPIFECDCDCDFLAVAINQVGNTLTAVHNCPFTPVFIWTNSAMDVVGTEASYTFSEDDTYTITIYCGTCEASEEIEVEVDCDLLETEIEGEC